MKRVRPALVGGAAAALLLGASVSPAAAASPVAHASAACEDYSNQAAAQRAADTRDPDGDGIYCEALPCPCLGAGGGSGSEGSERAAERRRARARARARARRRARARARARVRAKARRRARLREQRQRRAIERGATVVIEVADGDTLRVRKDSGKVLRVRLIGIDTPETRDPGTPVQCGGPESTSNMLALTFPAPVDSDGDGLFDQGGTPEGASVALKTDRTQDLFDRYGRALAYDNVLGGGQANRAPGYDVGLDQIRAGWSAAYVFDEDFARLGSYTDAESAAANAGVGVYGKCGGDFHAPT